MASAWFQDNWPTGDRDDGLAARRLDAGELSAWQDPFVGSGSAPADDARDDIGFGGSGEALLRPMPEPEEPPGTTPAGLPKRRPRSNLIPGSSGPIDPPAAIPARSAEQVRGRLASYQQGVRQGRENRDRQAAEAGAPGNRHTTDNYREESP
jgi:hypothetical protein